MLPGPGRSLVAGSFGGRSARTCVVPRGVPVFGPVWNTVCLVEGAPPVAVAADCGMDIERASATLDGEALPTEPMQGPLPFTLDLPADNPLFDLEGPVEAVAAGEWFGPLELPPGEHLLEISVRSTDGFSLDVRYALTVR